MNKHVLRTSLLNAVINQSIEIENAFKLAELDFIPENHNHAACVELMIKAGADVNKKEESGLTALMKAASNDLVDCLDILINAGADVNATMEDDNYTPLNLAAFWGSNGCVQKLISAGANVNFANHHGESALALSVWQSPTQWDGYVQDRKRSYFAVNCNRKECVALLLDAGADVNACDFDGRTALMKASQNGYGECVELLVEAGADVNVACRNDCYTPLKLAAMYGHDGCLRTLLSAGANVNAKDDIGSTALLIASTYGHDCAVKELIEAGADVNAIDGEGFTALTRAAGYARIKCVELILNAGVSVKTKNKRWRHCSSSGLYTDGAID